MLLSTVPVRGQTPGTCELGQAEGMLDVNEVRAAVFNTGSLFFGNAVDDGSGYVVPWASGNSAIFAGGLWVGGRVAGETRVAGSRYTRFEYWPGPLGDGAVLPNPSDCSAYDRIFVVSRQDVARYLQTGEATDDLRDWPASWGAPVLDGDGVEGNYNLSGGDQPAILGQQMAWWVMNDVGNVHMETESAPLGVEVQVSAFASPDGALPVRQATFYRYVITNRNSLAIDSAHVSFWSDPDLGDGADDYIGADTTRSYGYVYNGSSRDAVYDPPPALGYQIVQGPVGLPNGRDDDHDGETDELGERLRMTAMTTFFGGGSATSDPRTASEYYNHMQGRWNDGTPITEGGSGYQSKGNTTAYFMPGDPVTGEFWSEISEGSPPGNRVIAVHTGPFRLDPGQSEEVVIALPFAQGSSHLDSVTQLRLVAQVTQNAWDFAVLAPSRVEVEASPPDVPGAVELTAPTPNPFRDRLTVRYTLPDAMPARVTVLDVLGREVAVLVQGEQAAGPRTVEVDTERWSPGLYIVCFELDTERRTFSVVKVR